MIPEDRERWEGEYEKAVADFTELIRHDSGGIKNGYSHLGWLWATCQEDRVRDGTRAVEYATKGCELVGWKGTWCLEAHAAAYAEAGQYREVVEWQKKALSFPESKRAVKAVARLKLYEEGTPYRWEL
jgi:tetratricopeptide (TPR) repeat protein